MKPMHQPPNVDKVDSMGLVCRAIKIAAFHHIERMQELQALWSPCLCWPHRSFSVSDMPSVGENLRMELSLFSDG